MITKLIKSIKKDRSRGSVNSPEALIKSYLNQLNSTSNGHLIQSEWR